MGHNLFKNILIPVDFTVNTEVAVCKALEVAAPGHIIIHLLYVKRPSVVAWNSAKATKKISPENRLEEWKESIENYREGVNVFCWLSRAIFVQQDIIKKAKELNVDLVVIGKKNTHFSWSFFNTVDPSAIVNSTALPVLTVRPGSLHNQIRNVVLPVNDHISMNKMNVIASLCSIRPVKIFLITYVSDERIQENFSASSLLKTFQWLKTHFRCQVEYAVLNGENRARAILQFAEKYDADILLLHNDVETKLGWAGKHIPDVISTSSKIQILAVKNSN